ncbi:MAG: hypothetical protein ACK443_11760 [Methylococcaceae bacterium]|jgi:hypothetical protein
MSDRIAIQVQDTRGNWLTIQLLKAHSLEQINAVLTVARERRPGKTLRICDGSRYQTLPASNPAYGEAAGFARVA